MNFNDRHALRPSLLCSAIDDAMEFWDVYGGQGDDVAGPAGDPLSTSERLRDLAASAGTMPLVGTTTPGGNIIQPDGSAAAQNNIGSTFLAALGTAAAGFRSLFGTSAAVPQASSAASPLHTLLQSPLLLVGLVIGALLLVKGK